MSLAEREIHNLDNVAEFTDAARKLLADSRRRLDIFSDSLYRPFFNNPQVVDAISQFVRANRQSRVRILIRDSNPLIGKHHRLLALAQRLSSGIKIRKINPSTDTPNWEFMTADGTQLIFCDDVELWTGVYQPENPVRARQLQDVFEQDWPLATTDVNLRQFSI